MDLGGAHMKIYAGIDLHSSNNYIGIINQEDQRVYQKRLPNQVEHGDDSMWQLACFTLPIYGTVIDGFCMREVFGWGMASMRKGW